MAATLETFFATCAPGVEPILHAEVRALGFAKSEQQVGGVYFEGTLADARRANLWLRTAVRVLMRVGRFTARDADELYLGASTVDWKRFLRVEGRLVVDARSTRSELDHTRFVEQRVKDAVVDQLRRADGTRPIVDREGADLGVHAHLFQNRCTLSVDTSGWALHRRGWRREQGPAPLAETLAAAVVMMSGWNQRAPFLDPFCGSGTLAIEAALMATNTAPGLMRRFGFERWPGHDAAAFEREREAARAQVVPIGKRVIRGSDRDGEQVRRAAVNVESAGLADAIVLEEADAREFAPRAGWNACVVSNLPYGKRVGAGERGDPRAKPSGGDVSMLYARFSEILRERARGFDYGLLVSDGPELNRLQLPDAKRTPFLNGGIDCQVVTGHVPD
ncbi:Ribosomal RNA large subunit methyltransferase L [Planctomycetes bacterium Pla163]|uniref:Ribosomal RNA large subunit methyltransferase L n=1 Tax=Rohdeia mirabilis TaxID=2528008 RepID=A0A518CUY1_9BACT|nr:Ribosomal RNA large subunit methyltransferase L [Planctomycetes bacterium Pla163]